MALSEADAKDQENVANTTVALEKDMNLTPAEKHRIHYVDDEVTHDTRAPFDDFGLPLSRRLTQGSTYSIHSMRSTISTRNIDPTLAIPIAYRTVSFNISNSYEKGIAQVKGAKEKAAKGRRNSKRGCRCPLLTICQF
jgi:hypothetical protein